MMSLPASAPVPSVPAPSRARLLAALSMPLLVIAAVVGLTAPASAQAHELADPVGPRPSSHSDFSLDIDVTTVLPLVVGAMGSLEMPGHVVLRAAGGVVPSGYVDAMNEVARGWGLYDADSAALAALLLSDATYLEFGLGVRPAGTPGIELSIGYVVLWTHRLIDAGAVGAPGRDAGLDVTIDAVHGEIAWQSEPVEHLYFRLAIGWAHAFAHDVHVSAEGDEATQRAMGEAASTLAATVGSHAFGPSLGVAVGARF